MPITLAEQETVIRVGARDTELTVSTTNPAHARQIERRGFTPERVGTSEGKPVAWTFRMPAEYFVLPRPKRRVSESQRAAAAERLKAMRGVS